MSIWLRSMWWLRSSWGCFSGLVYGGVELGIWLVPMTMRLGGMGVLLALWCRSWWAASCWRFARCLVDRGQSFTTGVAVGSIAMGITLGWLAVDNIRKDEEVIQAEVAAELASRQCICVDGLERLVELVDE